MHPEARTACERAMRGLLGKTTWDGLHLDYPDTGDASLIARFTETTAKYLGRWATSSDAFAILNPRLKKSLRDYRRMRERDTLPSLWPPTGLPELLGEVATEQLIAEVLAVLDDLPAGYVGYFRMTTRFTPFPLEPNMPIAPAISFVRGDQLAADVDIHSAIRAPGKTYYLKVSGSGLYRADSSDSVSSQMINTAKQVVALGLSVGIFHKLSVSLPPRHAPVYNSKTGEAEVELNVPAPIASQLGQVILDRSIQTPAEFQARCERLEKCLAHADKHSDILTAAEWLFDAEGESNQTLSYIYTAIGLEAVLDSPSDDITKTLADRLAYSVGKTRSERSELRDKFTEFYGHRSKIVHGKKARLGSVEVKMLDWGQALLRRAIERELSILD